MKSRVLIVGLLAGFAPSSACAQDKGSTVGVLAGVNFASIGGADAVGVKSRTAFVGGIFSRSALVQDLDIETQVLYSQQGAKGAVGQAVSGRFELSYLEIPVLLSYAVPTRSSVVRPRLFAGPGVAFKVGCQLTASLGPITPSIDCSDAGLGVRTTDVRLVGGIGADIGRFTVAARYDHGLRGIDGSGLASLKNRVFSLTAGFGIRIKG